MSEKPNYEIGSSTKLSFGKKTEPAASKVWKLDVDEDDEMINADDLLDEEDKQKPSSESLKVCATTGKRKACKDCSCGLAEELDAEAKGNTVDPNPTQKSSCGSVSLPQMAYQNPIRFRQPFTVLSRRCFPLLNVPLSRPASLQARREDSADRHEVRCLGAEIPLENKEFSITRLDLFLTISLLANISARAKVSH